MSSSTKILVGLLSGVFVGLFLGEHASVLKIVADGFVKLLQMTVLPYITLSIITSLGALSYDQVKRLGLRAGTVNPKYTVVVPEPGVIKIPLAYPLAGRDRDWAYFLNTWIELKRRDGTLDALYGHWILGKQAAARKPRWSIMRNVLHWVE